MDYDVVIVGGGPGGSTAGRLCARAGLKTLLIEKERFPRYKPCGGCLSLKTVHLLDLDLDPVIENTIFGAKFSYCCQEPFSIETREPIALMVMRDRFDHFLIQKAREVGAEVLEGERVTRVEAKGRGLETVLANGEKIRSIHLIGADGPQSVVARSISLPTPKGSDSGIAFQSEIPLGPSIPLSAKELRFVHLDFGRIPNGYGWVFPKKENLSIGIGGMIREAKKANARQYLDAFLKDLGYVPKEKTIKLMGHPLPSFYDECQKVSRGNVLLVGDAAHLMDPLQGEGIYYAIRSGILAAEAILKSTEKGLSPSDLYEQAVHFHISANLKWALPFSRLVFRFTKLAYKTLKRYPELADLYLRVLDGRGTYQGFVESVKDRMKDLLKGRISEKIRRAMARA